MKNVRVKKRENFWNQCDKKLNCYYSLYNKKNPERKPIIEYQTWIPERRMFDSLTYDFNFLR
jgi:hypothetical protein